MDLQNWRMIPVFMFAKEIAGYNAHKKINKAVQINSADLTVYLIIDSY